MVFSPSVHAHGKMLLLMAFSTVRTTVLEMAATSYLVYRPRSFSTREERGSLAIRSLRNMMTLREKANAEN